MIATVDPRCFSRLFPHRLLPGAPPILIAKVEQLWWEALLRQSELDRLGLSNETRKSDSCETGEVISPTLARYGQAGALLGGAGQSLQIGDDGFALLGIGHADHH